MGKGEMALKTVQVVAALIINQDKVFATHILPSISPCSAFSAK